MFRRALATGNVLMATSAAREVGRLDLDDALGLTLLYRDQDPARYTRAAVRWHSPFCAEARNITPEDSQPGSPPSEHYVECVPIQVLVL
jgi:hypothetical protein